MSQQTKIFVCELPDCNNVKEQPVSQYVLRKRHYCSLSCLYEGRKGKKMPRVVKRELPEDFKGRWEKIKW